MAQNLDREIDRNFDHFQRHLAQHLPAKEGQFALMHDCAFIEFYQTPFEAEQAGEAHFADGVYSIQEVTDAPVDLGTRASLKERMRARVLAEGIHVG